MLLVRRRGFDEFRLGIAGAIRCAINPVKHQCVQMGVEIGGTAKALDQGDGTSGGLLPFDTCLFDEMGVNRAVDNAQHRGDEFGVYGEQAPQRYGERQHPLAHRHARQDVVHQGGGGLDHSAGAARGADASAFAAERHQCVACTAVAGQAQKAVGEDAALKIGLEFVFDELR